MAIPAFSLVARLWTDLTDNALTSSVMEKVREEQQRQMTERARYESIHRENLKMEALKRDAFRTSANATRQDFARQGPYAAFERASFTAARDAKVSGFAETEMYTDLRNELRALSKDARAQKGKGAKPGQNGAPRAFANKNAEAFRRQQLKAMGISPEVLKLLALARSGNAGAAQGTTAAQAAQQKPKAMDPAVARELRFDAFRDPGGARARAEVLGCWTTYSEVEDIDRRGKQLREAAGTGPRRFADALFAQLGSLPPEARWKFLLANRDSLMGFAHEFARDPENPAMQHALFRLFGRGGAADLAGEKGLTTLAEALAEAMPEASLSGADALQQAALKRAFSRVQNPRMERSLDRALVFNEKAALFNHTDPPVQGKQDATRRPQTAARNTTGRPTSGQQSQGPKWALPTRAERAAMLSDIMNSRNLANASNRVMGAKPLLRASDLATGMGSAASNRLLSSAPPRPERKMLSLEETRQRTEALFAQRYPNVSALRNNNPNVTATLPPPVRGQTVSQTAAEQAALARNQRTQGPLPGLASASSGGQQVNAAGGARTSSATGAARDAAHGFASGLAGHDPRIPQGANLGANLGLASRGFNGTGQHGGNGQFTQRGAPSVTASSSSATGPALGQGAHSPLRNDPTRVAAAQPQGFQPAQLNAPPNPASQLHARVAPVGADRHLGPGGGQQIPGQVAGSGVGADPALARGQRVNATAAETSAQLGHAQRAAPVGNNSAVQGADFGADIGAAAPQGAVAPVGGGGMGGGFGAQDDAEADSEFINKQRLFSNYTRV